MRKLILMIIMVTLAGMMVFVSCNGLTSLPDENTPSEEVPSTPVEPGTPEMPESPEEPEVVSLGTPEIGLNGFVNHGDYSTAAIWMKSAWNSAKIFYTTDGSTPSERNGSDYRMNNRPVVCVSPSGMQYVSSGVEVTPGCTVNAVALYLGTYSNISTFEVPEQ